MRQLLIDGDIIVHRMAHVNQWEMEWDADTWSYFADFGRAKAQFDTWVTDAVERLWADGSVIFLSDSAENWRHGVAADYKGHRASWQQVAPIGPKDLPAAPGPKRPMLYAPLRQWLLESRGAIVEPRLEADDLLGIFATSAREGVEPVVVTVDKDLRTVPGLHWNPDKPGAEITKVSPEQARYNHFYLVLVGDSSDGYKGCPGVGPVKAKQALAKSNTWETVVGLYEKAGLTANDALVQARIARVLQKGDYDFKTKEIKLWTPTN